MVTKIVDRILILEALRSTFFFFLHLAPALRIHSLLKYGYGAV